MKASLVAVSTLVLLCAAGTASASTCPSTPDTNSDCGFLITIGTNGMATVSAVTGATAFNGAQTFGDGTSDPGNDGSLVGIMNDYSQSLTSLTVMGKGANAGIFDFSFNGICVYTKAAYCGTAATGYEGPTTTFTDLKSTVLFENNVGTVDFNPALGTDMSTYFALEGNPADISANGGLSVSNLTFSSTTAVPEPADFGLAGAGLAALALWRRKATRKH